MKTLEMILAGTALMFFLSLIARMAQGQSLKGERCKARHSSRHSRVE
jgi:hypothetical protein